MKLSKSKLENALKRLAQANNKAREAESLIYAHAKAVYGVEPSEIDNDAFLDACCGACGAANGMTADEFDLSMREHMEIQGIEMPGTTTNE